MRAAFFPSLLLTALLTLGLTAGYNYRADPYWLLQAVEPVDGPDHRDLFFHLRLHKPYAMYYPEARSIVLGSSTLGPMRPAPLFGNQASYNGALPGATLYEVRRMLEHALAIAPVERLVLGLEFYQFRASKRLFMPGFAEDRLLRPAPTPFQQLAKRGQQFRDLWSALLSRNALAETLFRDPDAPGSQRLYYYDGSWQSRMQSISPRGLFNLIAVQKYAEFSEFDNRVDYTQLDELLDLCELHDIELTVLLSPLHSYTLSAIDMAGGLDSWSQWMATTVERLNRRGIEPKVLAARPRLLSHGIDAKGGLFLDGVHYQGAGAARIKRCLSAQLDGKTCSGAVSLQALTTELAAEYLEALRRLVESYPERQGGDYRKLEKLIAAQRAQQDAGVDIAARYR